MAILVDYNQVIIASLFASIGNHHNVDLDENLVRHMFLNSIRANKKKFGKEYGEIVICADSQDVWRRDLYPYYKANRRKSKGESDLDWKALFVIMDNIRNELIEYFPYKVIKVDRTEADDIIGVVIHHVGTELYTGSEKYLVLSADGDYVQLQKFANVDQYDPIRKRWLKHANPEMYLAEHIIKGDTGDGVPNILSPDNCLAIGERQKPMTQKRLTLLMGGEANMDVETKLRYNRNKQMIDLSQVPQNYKDIILEEWDKPCDVGRGKLFNYFIQKKLKHLITDIQDF
jgi:5'-3' exonuclease